MKRTTCSMSARDPANAGPARSGNMIAKADSASVMAAMIINISNWPTTVPVSSTRESKRIYIHGSISAGNSGIPGTSQMTGTSYDKERPCTCTSPLSKRYQMRCRYKSRMLAGRRPVRKRHPSSRDSIHRSYERKDRHVTMLAALKRWAPSGRRFSCCDRNKPQGGIQRVPSL